ncbi:MAG: FtsQ-type POTRA domain-containing protein [Desulfobacterales bacterium]|nr:FtsQ-type POTRA domain-containing protein [Desulfobacterales bacterium]
MRSITCADKMQHLRRNRNRSQRWFPVVNGRTLAKGAGMAGLVILLWLGANLAHQWMCSWDFFRITTIEVNGCNRTTEQEIKAKSGVDVHSNLMALKPALVEEALAQHPWIDQVKISRDWPNRLLITIKEKEVAAIINRRDGLFYIDRRGRAFWPAAAANDLDFPVMTGNFNAPGPIPATRLKQALHFLELARRSSNSFLQEQNISEIHLSEQNELVLFLLGRPFPIYLGHGGIKQEYSRLLSLLKQLYRSKEFASTAFIDMGYMPDKALVGKNNGNKKQG